MDAKELRIGNLVKDHLSRTQKVHEVRNDSYICYLSNGSKLKYKLNTTKPIPLTEQWLLDFGFEKSEKGSVSIQFNIGENPLTKDWIMQLVWLKTLPDYNLEESLFYRNGFHKLYYVHQLQNLYFALTNTELTIK